MAEVALDDVTKVYANGVRAVHGVTLRAGDGELLVLVGPSGSGKTTTLRLIAGLEEPSSGTICIGGRAMNGVPARQRDAGMVFQRPALYPHLRVRDNLAFALRLRGGGRAVAQRVDETAALLGLNELLDFYPAQLSGGQQQRVALGRALVRRPALFLLDEPLSNLDAHLRGEMRRELHLLQRRLRATMIYVTHDPQEALALGDRVAVFRDGAIEGAGEPGRLYDRPPNRFVAGFLGWPPMNFADGELQSADGRLQFRSGEWSVPVPRGPLSGIESRPARRVILGLRPADVNLAGPDGAHLRMDVALVEGVGEGRHAGLVGQGWKVTARVLDGMPVREGARVGVMLNLGRGHWFDAETGVALPAGGSTA